MKKLMSSMLAIAAMASMISCSTEDILDEGGQIDNGPVEMRLSAGVSATTKAAINSDFKDDFDVYFFRPEDAATAVWTSGDMIKATVSAAAGHAITFKNDAGEEIKEYYNDNVNLKSYLAACHIGTSTAVTNNLATAGNISFTITGQEDIMATDGLQGDKAKKFDPFEFKHLLSQIQIDIKGDLAAQAAFGKIKKVEIKNADTQLQLTLGSTPTIAPVAAATPANITVYNDATGKDLTAAGATIGSTVMIYNGGDTPYGTATKSLTLLVTSSKDGVSEVTSEVNVNNITDNTDNGLVTGKNHVITLNFKEKISATASVAAWGTGGTGNGSVE